MWAKVLLIVLCLLMIGTAIHFDPLRQRSLLASGSHDGPHLRLITWNIGYAELENDSRAHTKDMQAVADTILSNDPDAIALNGDALWASGLFQEAEARYQQALAPPRW